MLPIGPRRVLLSSVAVWSASLAACSSSEHARDARMPPVASASESPIAVASAPDVPLASPTSSAAARDPGLDLEAAIASRSVTSEKLGFGVLYTWTTDAQLEELQKGEPLLTRVVSKKLGPSMFDGLVASEVQRGRDVAKLLWHEGFAKKRFAWPSPYAALRGEPDSDYGRVLVRVELKPDAWILDYGRGIVHALDGTRHTPEELAAHPERLAAVYHDGPGFREFVLVNEAMVARFAAGGAKSVSGAVGQDIELLQALAGHVEDEPSDSAMLQRFAATAIFADEKFFPSALRKRAKLLDDLRSLGQPAVEREPALRFDLGPPRATPAPACKVVRRDVRRTPAFEGSFVRPATTTYVAVCESADPSDPGTCQAGSGPQPGDAVCTPVPTFGR